MRMPRAASALWIRRRSSRATSSWRLGAVRACKRKVRPPAARDSTPNRRGPSIRVCAQAASARNSAATASKRGRSLIEGLVGGDERIEKELSPVAAEIGDTADFAVGYRDQRALGIAEDGAAQGQMFDAAGDLADAHGVAHNVLVLKHGEETVDDVAHHVLRAEAQRQAGQSGRRSQRRDVETKHRQRQQHGQNRDDARAGAVEHARECAGLLFAHLGGAPAGFAGRLHQALRHDAQQAVRHQGQEQDRQQAGPVPQRQFYPLKKLIAHISVIIKGADYTI